MVNLLLTLIFNEQKSALELACVQKRKDMIIALLDRGADPTQMGSSYRDIFSKLDLGKDETRGSNGETESTKSEISKIYEEYKQLEEIRQQQQAQIEKLLAENKLLKGRLSGSQSPSQRKEKRIEKLIRSSYTAVVDTLTRTRQLNQIHRREDIDEFEIHGVLGSGGFGIVYDCSVPEKRNGKTIAMHRVALKMVTNWYLDCNTQKIAEMNQREYCILWDLKDVHQNILPILSQFTGRPTKQMIDLLNWEPLNRDLLWNSAESKFKTTQFYITEKLECTLDTKLNQKNLKSKQRRKYCLNVSAALKFLYDNHIVHRDIKGNNILITADDTAMLTDFGVCVKADKNYFVPRAQLDGGNPLVLSPEVEEQLELGVDMIDFSSQYSWELGCMIYLICCGELPIRSHSLEFSAKMKQVLTGNFRELLTRALAVNQQERILFPEFCSRLERMKLFN